MVDSKVGKRISWMFGILFMIVFFLRRIVLFITDYQWFSKNGILNTYLVRVVTQGGLLAMLWLFLYMLLYFYLKHVKKIYYEQALLKVKKGGDKAFEKLMQLYVCLTSGLIALGISGALWLRLRLFLSATPFEGSDPIFGMPIDFYMFKLPFFQQILNELVLILIYFIFSTVGLLLILLMKRPAAEGSVYYVETTGFILNESLLDRLMRRDIAFALLKKFAFLGTGFFLILALKFYLMTFELLYSTRGVAYGASYTDIHVSLLSYRVAVLLGIVGAILFFYGTRKEKIRLVVGGPILLLISGLVFSIVGLTVQQLVVEPDEIGKESQYLTYNISYTQDAFDLGEVEEIEYPVEQRLDKEALMRNSETVENIRINDARPLTQTYNQIQGIRLYYTFNDIDLDRYMIDGKYTQVFISTRELDQDRLPDQAKTWINEHLKYTHGYGVVMSPVNLVTEEGQPELVFKNVPPITSTDLVINRPELYFGELTNRYIIVNTEEDEFDYPSGSDNVTTRYEGKAGIELSGLNKLLFSYRERSMKLLVSSIVSGESRIILYRNIVDRVKRIAPFLEYDQNPYLVLNQEDGKLYWIIDAYTVSEHYPYSQPFSLNGKKVNYMRNSVKVVIDAYEGTTDFYIFDESDPLIQTYQKIYTDLFSEKEELVEGLMDHIRYPQDYFDMQTEVYRAYHVNNPTVFYNGEDIWDVAKEKYMDGVQAIESNYVMFKLPDNEEKEFALIVPYTPREKPNMTSLLVARSDKEYYGELFIYKFPKDKTIQGPLMIEARIDQDSVISPQFTLWGQKGSAVLRGNLIVVPIENSLLYVEPIYIKADNPNSLPEMKRVIVAYEDQVVMEETLDEALERIFGSEKFIEVGTDTEMSEIIDEINRLFEENKKNLETIESLLQELNQKAE